MKMIVEAGELKQAVVQYLKCEYGIAATAEELQPVYEKEGEYEDLTHILVGFSLNVTSVSFKKG